MNGSHPRSRRLLIYSQDGLGLGHLRRTTLLASAFLKARPDGAVLTVCDSPTGHFFGTDPGHDYLKLPSIRKVRPGEWSPISLPLPFSDILEMRKAIIRTAALGFRPDVLLVDHMPHGSMGELVPTLEALAGAPVKKILGLRDILDSPETIGRRWRLEGAFEAVERHFDDVLVYGSRDVFDVASSYGWPSHLEDRLHYCGYVCAPTAWSADDAVCIRQSHGATAGTKLIVAMAGGGADAFPLFETLVLAMHTVRSQQDCRLLLVAGPFLPRDREAALRRLAEGLPIEVVSTVSDSLGVMAAADLLVTMAGYNTTAELLRVGTPALLVPRRGPSEEQQMRASRLARRGWVHWLPPAELSPVALAAAVLSGLDPPETHGVRPPDLDGLQRAAEYLVGDLPLEGAAEDESASPAHGDPVVRRAAGAGLAAVTSDVR